MTHNTTEPTLLRNRLPALLLILSTSACVAVGDDADPITPRDHEHVASELTEAVASATEIWDAACPHTPLHGLCVDFARVEPTAGCGPRMLGNLRVGARSEPEVARAHEAFDDALEATTAQEPTDPVARAAVRNAMGRAQIAKIDAEFETYLAMTIDVPGLGAPDATLEDPAMLATFRTAFEAKVHAGNDLAVAYAALRDTDDPESLVRGALRTTWAMVHVIDEVMSMAVPGDRRTAEARKDYCDALHESTATAVATSLGTAQWCVETAHKRGYAGPEVAQCQALVHLLEARGRASKPASRDG